MSQGVFVLQENEGAFVLGSFCPGEVSFYLVFVQGSFCPTTADTVWLAEHDHRGTGRGLLQGFVFTVTSVLSEATRGGICRR